MSKNETPIKLSRGCSIRINCPSPAKYSAFAKAFHGIAGTVLMIEPHGAADVIVVDVSTIAQPGQWINVDRSWLSHDRGRHA